MESTAKPHIGRKITRIRELRGIKQEALAQELGVSQQTISRIESSDVVEEEMLAKVAEVLGVRAEAIENFSEEAIFNYFNNFHDTVREISVSTVHSTLLIKLSSFMNACSKVNEKRSTY